MCADRVFTASYRGYVYVDADEGLHVPSASSIKKAFGLLQKPKKARYKHPLFARGMETELFLTVGDEGFDVSVPGADALPVLVMHHPVNKIAYAATMGRKVAFLTKRPSEGVCHSYKCHMFVLAKEKEAISLVMALRSACNSVLRKLKGTRRGLEKKLKAKAKEAGQVSAEDVEQKVDEDLLLEELKALQDTEEAFDLFADEFQDDLFGGTSTDIDEGMVAEFAEFSDEFAELAVKLAGQIETAKSRASSRKSSVREVAASVLEEVAAKAEKSSRRQTMLLTEDDFRVDLTAEDLPGAEEVKDGDA